MNSPHEFSRYKKEGLYEAIHKRRDVRRNFLPKKIPQDVLARLLYAAHHAPSVGFMQPWDFILITDDPVRNKIKIAFDKANENAKKMFSTRRSKQYSSLKLEGILEAPLNICVTCDRKRNGPVVLGTTSQPHMDLYSTVCAIQNIWLTARVEGIGMGWVSIIDSDELKEILKIPQHFDVVAYLCLGYVENFASKPDLELANWLPRLNLSNLIHVNQFDQEPDSDWALLIHQLQQLQNVNR